MGVVYRLHRRYKLRRGDKIVRECTKWTTGYQFRNIWLVNLKAIAIEFVFIAVFFAFMTRPVLKEIFSVVFIAVYFSFIYFRSNKFAMLDKRGYTPTHASALKGVLLGVMISLTFGAALLIYKLIWQIDGADGVISSVPALSYSVAFWFYTVPYSGIMGLAHGQMMWYSKAAMLLIPIAASTAGYVAGLKNFSFADVLVSSVYEKKEE